MRLGNKSTSGDDRLRSERSKLFRHSGLNTPTCSKPIQGTDYDVVAEAEAILADAADRDLALA